MKCPLTGKPCLKHKAYTVKDKDEEEKTHSVCEDCLHLNKDVWVADEFGACPSCGTRLESIVKKSRAGCAACYSHFETPLSFVISAVQGGATEHRGEPPESYKKAIADSTRAVAFATELLVRMKTAARDGRYEEASRLKALVLRVKEFISASNEKGELQPDDGQELSRMVMEYRWSASAESLE